MADTGARVARDRLIVAIAGGSGAIYGIRALEALKRLGTIEAHLIVTPSAARTLGRETGVTLKAVERLADVVHRSAGRGPQHFAGAIDTRGLLVAPCAVETLRAIAEGDDTGLVAPAAAACLKARRRVALLFTETPLDLDSIGLMAKATRLGAVVVPPVPAFYHRPKALNDIIDQTVGRALDLFDIEAGLVRRWTEGDRALP
ncbi:MAG: UbiX family flavin prenyltransferase [Alphaproteobacteria bacterium]|nr:UbiX family flavin prenyltransferase [Alphaproteobacteria bacterium]